MANKIVRDSHLPIFVKSVDVPEATLVNALIGKGSIVGLANDKPRKGEDGLFYVMLDTAAEIRVDAVTGVWAIGAPVYMTSGFAPATGSASGSRLIGYATRAKTNASAPLWIQLVPSAAVAA